MPPCGPETPAVTVGQPQQSSRQRGVEKESSQCTCWHGADAASRRACWADQARGCCFRQLLNPIVSTHRVHPGRPGALPVQLPQQPLRNTTRKHK